MENNKIYICLEDGNIFEGKSFGAKGEVLGELVFTTGMGGYIETLTDPSYFGQIVMQTFPLIGNYGFIDEDMESDGSAVSAYVVREYCENPSNFRCDKTLDEFLKSNNIVGVYDIDTREITKIIREHGVMNAVITADPDNVDFGKAKAYKVENAVKSVSCKAPAMFPSENHIYNVVLIDYGTKKNIVRELNKRGCNVAVVPYDTKAEDILSLNPDGIMLSNGPGDPQENTEAIEELKKLIGKKPIFAICLGHQLLALSQGAETTKLKYGHRGVNQPVKNLETGRTFISSQNHGYAVVSESVEKAGGCVSYVNANDNTCEGIDYKNKQAFSVQFHPEACSGPLDTRFIFDKFIDMMGGKK
ncbi:MAG: carbamoyl phosphate synthase small subunit [Acetobacter sp.]|nr:carbamoyl phosphate synthase small subunit [Bacteroides sp.]MCM1340455.1 carbamoyl phosphate synthase small subunit [Acetobacter sp.]MCM1433195.1 carbamoyl phosphate synthase small subunit [Clostridiales bacterium]